MKSLYAMSRIPIDKSPDSTLALLREGYLFISNRRKKYGADIFQTRFMLEKTICMGGAESTAIFYDNKKFERKGAAPKRVQKTLFGQKGVQTLDDGAHHYRKIAFMSLMTPEKLQNLAHIMDDCWRAAIQDWEGRTQVTLYDQVQQLLCRAVCRWTEVPLREKDVAMRARDFGAMADAFGGVGLRHWRGKIARKRQEHWARKIIEEIRAGKCHVAEHSAAHVMAFLRGPDGKLLEPRVAAVELINILRPTVAIATYITFCALALHQFPMIKRQLQQDDTAFRELFVQEVRRYYPFTPLVGARVRRPFEWKDCAFEKGVLVLLDVYGINHDERIWNRPEEFIPERFLHWDENPFNFIPQGGGDHFQGHRCAGEWLTIQAMEQSVQFLTRNMTYEVPQQKLDFALSRMPTLPESGFIINRVKAVKA